MTDIQTGAGNHANSLAATGLSRLLRALLALTRRRRGALRTYLDLAHHDERLLYDIGLDPLDLRDALNGRYGPSVLFEPVRKRP